MGVPPPVQGRFPGTDSDSEVSSAASLEMEPLQEQTLADLMEHWVQAKRVKTEEPGPEPHGLPQTGKPAPPKICKALALGGSFRFRRRHFRLGFRSSQEIVMLGKGNWRVVYSYNDRLVLKLADVAHGNEAKIARLLPSITAEVLWEGPVHVSMHDGAENTLIPFHSWLPSVSSR